MRLLMLVSRVCEGLAWYEPMQEAVMNRKTIVFVSSVVFAASSLTLAGCYTIEGAGRDVAATGAGVAAGAEGAREHGAQMNDNARRQNR